MSRPRQAAIPSTALTPMTLLWGIALLLIEKGQAASHFQKTTSFFAASSPSSSLLLSPPSFLPRLHATRHRDNAPVVVPRGGSSSTLEEQDSEDKDEEDDVTLTPATATTTTQSSDDEDAKSSPAFLSSQESPDMAKNEEEEDEEEDDDDEEEEEEGENGDEPATLDISQQRVALVVQTKLDNEVLDHRMEMNSKGDKTIETIKSRISKGLPGRPPILALELSYEGRTLPNNMVLDELVMLQEDDEDDEDDGDVHVPIISLILNIVPPVDPKFATDLVPKGAPHYEGDDKTLSTDTLLDAYFLNQVAMERNAQLLADPNTKLSPLARLEMKEQAKFLREQLQSQTDATVWEKSLTPIKKTHNLEERRGQRYRSGKGGATTNLKKVIQTNLNVDWGDTIRNFFLFLFFGYFGGRNSLSRWLLLLGAPMSLVFQARPAKMWLKTLFYLMKYQPIIVLSLLPAPEHAILTADDDASMAALYGTPLKPQSFDDGEEEADEDEDDEDEYEVEEDVYDEDDEQ